jgi:hypothetical protein
MNNLLTADNVAVVITVLGIALLVFEVILDLIDGYSTDDEWRED